LVVYLARLLKTPEEEIDINQSFESFGMDSAAVIGLTGDLMEWSSLELDETVVYNHGNIAQLARYVSSLSR
jgi:acyl carrier protein